MVRSPLMAARATFALKAGEWFRRGRLLMVSPVHGDYRRCQAETPLIVLFRFPGPALTTLSDRRTRRPHPRRPTHLQLTESGSPDYANPANRFFLKFGQWHILAMKRF